MSERAEALRALRALMEHVEAGTLHQQPYGGMPMATACYGGDFTPGRWSDGHCLSAYHGSLDAVARLEAPLRERGWEMVVEFAPRQGICASTLYQPSWGDSDDGSDDREPARAVAPTEARARLLAVLKALLHEEENHAP